MTATEHVILVDEYDNPVGTAEKMEAHRHNLRHRAFSVFIFRKTPPNACLTAPVELLLQQRAAHKYHSPNLWTNTCCSHPRPGEDIIHAGERRLQEEMGLQLPLSYACQFHYIAHFENGLVENEIDYILTGWIGRHTIRPAPEEVQAYRWVTGDQLKQELSLYPTHFTPWLPLALHHLEAKCRF